MGTLDKWKRRGSKASKIGDKIVEAFKVPQRKAFIDEEIDLITNEESQERIVKLLIILAIILSIISVAFLSLIQVENQRQFIISNTVSKSYLEFPKPQIAMIDQVGNGTLVKYWIDQDQTLHYSSSLKLPSPEFGPKLGYFKKSINYLAYVENKDVVIIGTDGQKDVTIVYSNSSHRTLTNSKYPFKRRILSTSVKTSKYFWILDGHKATVKTPFGEPMNPLWQNSHFWAIKKQAYFLGPSLPNELAVPSGGSCGMSLNQSHVLILFLTYDETEDLDYLSHGCLAGWIYDFNRWQWINLPWCIKGYEMEVFSVITCTSYFTKTFQLLIMTWVKNLNKRVLLDDTITIANPDNGQIIQRIQLQDTGKWLNGPPIPVPKSYDYGCAAMLLDNQINYVSFVTSQGIVFMVSINRNAKEVFVSIFNGTNFVKKQQIHDFAFGQDGNCHKDEELQLVALAL